MSEKTVVAQATGNVAYHERAAMKYTRPTRPGDPALPGEGKDNAIRVACS